MNQDTNNDGIDYEELAMQAVVRLPHEDMLVEEVYSSLAVTANSEFF